jgi:hypothetical protein
MVCLNHKSQHFSDIFMVVSSPNMLNFLSCLGNIIITYKMATSAKALFCNFYLLENYKEIITPQPSRPYK